MITRGQLEKVLDYLKSQADNPASMPGYLLFGIDRRTGVPLEAIAKWKDFDQVITRGEDFLWRPDPSKIKEYRKGLPRMRTVEEKFAPGTKIRMKAGHQRKIKEWTYREARRGRDNEIAEEQAESIDATCGTYTVQRIIPGNGAVNVIYVEEQPWSWNTAMFEDPDEMDSTD